MQTYIADTKYIGRDSYRMHYWLMVYTSTHTCCILPFWPNTFKVINILLQKGFKIYTYLMDTPWGKSHTYPQNIWHGYGDLRVSVLDRLYS